MATLKFKRSAVPGKAPTIADIDLGEVAINTYDGKLYLKKDDGTQSIVDVGAGGGSSGVSSFNTRTGAVTLTSSDVTTALGYTPSGTVTSVGVTVPTGLSVSGSPITTSGTIAISLASGYSIPTTASQTNWDSAYTDRLKWDGGATGLTASTGRTSLGATTVGSNFFTLTNPSAITFPRINADNTISALDAATFRTAIGAGTGAGTVTSVGVTVPTGLSVSGSPITSSGTIAISLAAGYSIPTTASQTNWDSAYTDRLKWDGGSTGLVAATGRTSLGATTVGGNIFTLTNPSAITFLRLNADNSVSALDAATFRTAIGAGTGSGTVTSISTGTGLTGGPITGTGTISLDNTTVTAGSYTNASITVDAQGRITAASSGSAGGTGTVTSVAMTVPTGLSISGSPITTSGTLAVTLQSGYSIPTTASQTNWDTAYTDRLKWDGGSTGLVAATARTSLGLVIGTDVQAYSANLAAFAGKAAPSGAVVGTTDTQTLTNKTLTGFTETVFSITGTTPAISAANGTIQTWTLSANSSPTDSLSSGQSVTLMVNDGTAFTITWPTITWVGGSAPTLDTTKYTVIELWKVSTTLYGALVGFA